MSKFFKAVPLLGFVLIAANFLAMLGSGFDTELLRFAMTSGVDMMLDAGDLIILVGLLLLYVEIFKATRTSDASIFDHIASLLVFLVGLIEFLLLPRFAHGAFLALIQTALPDCFHNLLKHQPPVIWRST
jgi:hypothetical protein